ncbi:MAG TPA: virulence-related protein [Acetivibrio sp.]|uniref:virulence-related protein n=1 Tax=Acetivibrio sp. TaxID=1872092 RepID=UPI002B8D8038|nr:virulence-related protein [Acetivibrio sp.]HOM03748.1 virulence-related protein [Acetivibrio sp.]
MERKEIVKALGEHFGVEPKYMGAPSFAYQIETAEETYTIDRAGKITTSAGIEVELDSILNGKNEKETSKPTAETATFEIAVPMEGHTSITLRNLVNMIYSKQGLIKKSLGLTANIIEDDFCIGINEAKTETLEDIKTAIEGIGEKRCPGIAFDFNNNTITFKFLEGEASPEKVKAYTQLVALLNQNAKTLKHVSAKAKDTDNDKFTFRVFLIRLGMVGDEYKDTRKILLENLEGNSAFRSGKKPDKKVDIATK